MKIYKSRPWQLNGLRDFPGGKGKMGTRGNFTNHVKRKGFQGCKLDPLGTSLILMTFHKESLHISFKQYDKLYLHSS